MRRRTIILGGVAVLAVGGIATCTFWPEEEDQGLPVTLGPPRRVGPPLRATVGGRDRVILLVRRSETEATSGTGWRGERLELRAYDAASLAPAFAAPVISGVANGFRNAGLIGEQAATIWLYGDALGAASAVDGQVFLGGDGFAAVTPDLQGAFGQARDAYRLEEALVFTFRGTRYRLDPRSFAAVAAPQPAAGLPPPTPAAPLGMGGPAGFRVPEALLGESWFGLPVAGNRPNDGQAQEGGRFLTASQRPDARGAAQRLWRAGTRRGPAPPPVSGSFDSGGRTAAAGDRPLLDRPAEVATMPVPMPFAGFLTAGGAEPLRPAGAPGLLLLHQVNAEAPLVLMRLDAEGRMLWTGAVSFPRLVSVLPGEATLVLVGLRGSGSAEQDVIASVALADGRVQERVLDATS
jgi:hypothetical protein